jgi:hypothetical protein
MCDPPDHAPLLAGDPADPPPNTRDIDQVDAWRRRQTRLGNRTNSLYWAACRAARLIASGDVTPRDALVLVETGIAIGIDEQVVVATFIGAMNSVPLEALGLSDEEAEYFACDVAFTAWRAALPPEQLAAQERRKASATRRDARKVSSTSRRRGGA